MAQEHVFSEPPPPPPEQPKEGDAQPEAPAESKGPAKRPIEQLARDHGVADWLVAAIKAANKLEDGTAVTQEELANYAVEIHSAKVKGT